MYPLEWVRKRGFRGRWLRYCCFGWVHSRGLECTQPYCVIALFVVEWALPDSEIRQ